jgi:hypothetical protein
MSLPAPLVFWALVVLAWVIVKPHVDRHYNRKKYERRD